MKVGRILHSATCSTGGLIRDGLCEFMEHTVWEVVEKNSFPKQTSQSPRPDYSRLCILSLSSSINSTEGQNLVWCCVSSSSLVGVDKQWTSLCSTKRTPQSLTLRKSVHWRKGQAHWLSLCCCCCYCCRSSRSRPKLNFLHFLSVVILFSSSQIPQWWMRTMLFSGKWIIEKLAASYKPVQPTPPSSPSSARWTQTNTIFNTEPFFDELNKHHLQLQPLHPMSSSSTVFQHFNKSTLGCLTPTPSQKPTSLSTLLTPSTPSDKLNRHH